MSPALQLSMALLASNYGISLTNHALVGRALKRAVISSSSPHPSYFNHALVALYPSSPLSTPQWLDFL